jgi:8-oxo-dGTP diphosphatase
VIRRNEHSDQVLIARRASGHLAGKWEFPGGKIEAGETPRACLQRELHEEMGISVTVSKFLTQSLHSYPEKTVRLMAYEAVHDDGEIILNVHDTVEWAAVTALDRYDLAPADRPIADYLKNTL